MDESALGTLRRRVHILDGESFHEWKIEILEIFNEYHLNKYLTSPCVPLVDPLHPTPDESLDMIRNLELSILLLEARLEI